MPIAVPIFNLTYTLGDGYREINVYPTLQFLYSHHIQADYITGTVQYSTARVLGHGHVESSQGAVGSRLMLDKGGRFLMFGPARSHRSISVRPLTTPTPHVLAESLQSPNPIAESPKPEDVRQKVRDFLTDENACAVAAKDRFLADISPEISVGMTVELHSLKTAKVSTIH